MTEKNILRKIYYNRSKLRNAIEKSYPNAKIKYYEFQINDLIEQLQEHRQSEQGRLSLINKYTNCEKIKTGLYELKSENDQTDETDQTSETNQTDQTDQTENYSESEYESESTNQTDSLTSSDTPDQISKVTKKFPKNTKINKSRIKYT